ncbi:unnamed protein product [Prorocentrum cordatum]|uniref:Uncharacterized protein n=1 Tax=Prorocentrum cordatum TaxID=2364126 RepID=A0ABN9UC35_9DINO|nr:unnamed protein product [Polarella glacialis]
MDMLHDLRDWGAHWFNGAALQSSDQHAWQEQCVLLVNAMLAQGNHPLRESPRRWFGGPMGKIADDLCGGARRQRALRRRAFRVGPSSFYECGAVESHRDYHHSARAREMQQDQHRAMHFFDGLADLAGQWVPNLAMRDDEHEGRMAHCMEEMSEFLATEPFRALFEDMTPDAAWRMRQRRARELPPSAAGGRAAAALVPATPTMQVEEPITAQSCMPQGATDGLAQLTVRGKTAAAAATVCWPESRRWQRRSPPSLTGSRPWTRARAKASAASASAATSGGGAGAPASPEAQAAGAVRAAARRFLAAGRLHGLRAERTRHEADVAAAVRAAESAVLRQERSRAEAAQRKDQAKREKAQKAREDAQRLLGAAYDGDAARVAEFGLPRVGGWRPRGRLRREGHDGRV